MALRFHTYRHVAAKYTQLLQTELALYYSDLTVRTWEVHMTTVVTEGGCYSNILACVRFFSKEPSICRTVGSQFYRDQSDKQPASFSERRGKT